MDEITITPVTPADAPDIRQLWLDAFPLKFAHWMGDAAPGLLDDWLRSVPAVFHGTHIARVNGTAVGYIQFRTRLMPEAAASAYRLFSLAWRHMGLTKALRCMARIAIGQLQPARRDQLLIEMIGVRDGMRGQGVGSRLLEFAETHARANGFTRLCLGVVVENAGAIRLYERFGFTKGGLNRSLVRWAIGSPGFYWMTKVLN